MFRISEIAHGSAEYRSTVTLRDAVLRRPLGLVFSEEELLVERDSIHLGTYESDELVACLVLRPIDGLRVQMRQVAVTPSFQRRGLGTALAEFAERRASDLGYETMVVYARETAVEFYDRLGYTRVAEPFYEVGLLHYRMHKALTSGPWPR